MRPCQNVITGGRPPAMRFSKWCRPSTRHRSVWPRRLMRGYPSAEIAATWNRFDDERRQSAAMQHDGPEAYEAHEDDDSHFEPSTFHCTEDLRRLRGEPT